MFYRRGSQAQVCFICDHACINQLLGAKVEFPELANAFTIIPIHFSIPYNARNFGSIKKLVYRISLKIVIQCCAYL